MRKSIGVGLVKVRHCLLVLTFAPFIIAQHVEGEQLVRCAEVRGEPSTGK